MREALAKKELFTYGLPALPLAFAGMPLYIHAPDYFATHLGAPLGLIGVILLSLRLIDAVQDPFIGRISDGYSSHRERIMLVAALILILSFTALFQPLEPILLLWFAFFMLLATTAFSVLSINLNTLGGLWSRGRHQKTQITSTREGLGLVGLLIAVSIPSVLQQFVSPDLAFFYVSIMLAVIMSGALIAFHYWQTEHRITVQKRADAVRLSVWNTLRSLKQRTKYFFAVYSISLLASSIPAVLVLFFIRDRLDAEHLTGLFLGVYFLAGAIGMPLWNQLSRRLNKYYAWGLSMGIAVIVFIWTFFLSSGDIWQYTLICLFSGIAFGADLSLPPSLLADFIQDEKTQADASLQFGLLTFMAKLALALASVIAFSLLELAQFEPGQANGREALLALSFTYAALPCLIKLIAMALLFYISKKGEQHEENLSFNYGSRHRA